ncbi:MULTISPECIES: hypothetical protein [Larkinella]|jgi:uncharacterized membrane protein YidH (DUF202 family)|uniref:Uncharacterized protein n=1 Tax=Larkinella humicola TaxID=2607654 RepID=A0A5N1JK73_9BACT|nr:MULTISPECIES: hypothetical protein [Larkinella]KAA9356860.1 hypothetical protein F0P93_03720 [Larkinella humicola]
MKGHQDYIRDIVEIRSMMERTSKFLSLSGWAGIMGGLYAIVGAYIAYEVFDFNPDVIEYSYPKSESFSSNLLKVFFLALIVLILTISTAIFLSYKKAIKRGEKLWNTTAKGLLINMTVPLIAGVLLILILISKGLIGFIAPLTLLFYGLALFNASNFTYEEVKSIGLIEIGLGLISIYFVEYGLLCWAVGFGVVHIIYGIYLHYRYER